MPNRIVKSNSYGKSSQLIDILSSIFALELFAPSKKIYLFSPWITDVSLLNNAYGQYRSLIPESDQPIIRLSSLLNVLSGRGSNICILTRPEGKNTGIFLARLGELIQWKYNPNLHEKILITDHFYFRGSMNFTYSGINLNDEHSELSTDLSYVSQAFIEAKRSWDISD
jgi:hypothetical protein